MPPTEIPMPYDMSLFCSCVLLCTGLHKYGAESPSSFADPERSARIDELRRGAGPGAVCQDGRCFVLALCVWLPDSVGYKRLRRPPYMSAQKA